MLFFARTAVQLLAAGSVVRVVRANCDILEPHGLGHGYLPEIDSGKIYGHQAAHSWDYVDDGNFIMSAGDLAHMDVMSYAVFSRTIMPDAKDLPMYEKRLAKYKKRYIQHRVIWRNFKVKLNAETDTAARKKLKYEMSSQNDLMDHALEEIEAYGNIIEEIKNRK